MAMVALPPFDRFDCPVLPPADDIDKQKEKCDAKHCKDPHTFFLDIYHVGKCVGVQEDEVKKAKASYQNHNYRPSTAY